MARLRLARRIAPASFGIALALLAAASPPFEREAAAQSASDLAAAKQWFSEGLKLEEAGKWVEARERFQRVESIKPTPQVTFHIGLCYSRTNDLVEAMVWLERAKERAQQARAADVADAADAELKALRPRVPSLEIVISKDAPKDVTVTKVSIDGEQSRSGASGAPVMVNPGEHEVAVEFSNGVVRKKVKVAEREVAKVAIDPPKGSPVAAVVPPVAGPVATAPATPHEPLSPPPDASAPSRGSGVVPWIFVGGGVAAAAGGAVLMVTSVGRFRDVCPDVCPREKEVEAREVRDSAIVPYYVGGALVGAGALAAGVGVYLLVSGGSSAASTRSAALPVPLVLPGGGGAGVTGSF